MPMGKQPVSAVRNKIWKSLWKQFVNINKLVSVHRNSPNNSTFVDLFDQYTCLSAKWHFYKHVHWIIIYSSKILLETTQMYTNLRLVTLIIVYLYNYIFCSYKREWRNLNAQYKGILFSEKKIAVVGGSRETRNKGRRITSE